MLSQGAALRESYRHFHSNLAEGMGRVVEEEVQRKFGRQYRLYFPEAFKSDVSARARALISLTQAGVPLADAMERLGIPPGMEGEA